MKKTKKSPGIKFNQALDSFYDAQPDIYAFLIDKGVSDDIAEVAQEMIADQWVNFTSNRAEKLLEEIEMAAGEIEKLYETIRKPLLKVAEQIDRGSIR